MKKRDKLLACGMALLLSCGSMPNTVRAANTLVDLTANASVEDNLLDNRTTTVSVTHHQNAQWVAAYSLFDVGSGTYILYHLKVPAGQGVTVTVNYKDWTGVGNGGVHQYSEQFKTAWFVTGEEAGADFGGNVDGWTEIKAAEEPSLSLFTYSYPLLEPDKTEDDTEFWACMKFTDNDGKYAGRAGWNDGAWVDCITFEIESGKYVPVTGVTVEPASLSLEPGKSAGLKASVVPKNAANRNLIWSSSDPAVARVLNGTVTALKDGTAEITAKSEDGGVEAKCTVTVTETHDKDIVLKEGTPFDTGILTGGAENVVLPASWDYSAGTGATQTKIVTADGLTFRDFGSNAYAIYKLTVPGGTDAVMTLKMVTDWNGVSGVTTGTAPRLNVFYTSSLPTADASWERADFDSDWKEKTADYRFTVSPMNPADRTVYVMLYSTYAGSQGAWIESLGFEAVRPEAVDLYVKAPTKTTYQPGEKPDFTGLIAAVKYSDGSTAILKPEDYEISPSGSLTKTTEITVKAKGTDLKTTFTLYAEGKGTNKAALIGGIAGGAVLAAGAVLLLLKGKKKKERKFDR